MAELLYKQEVYQIMGACFNVYNDKGCGFLEPVYQECFEMEMAHQDIPFQPQVELELTYRGRALQNKYMPDAVCYEKIIAELKAERKLTDEHRAQVMNYLKATGYRLGLLINFGHHPDLQYERIINTQGWMQTEE